MAFEVTEIVSKNRRGLIIPESRVCLLWTSLESEAYEVLRLYRDRGTSEQYHSELKTDLGMERLPSGKFLVNAAYLSLGMLVYNMMRVMSDHMIGYSELGLKKAARRRTSTIMNCFINICARFVRHARYVSIYINSPSKWFEMFNIFYLKIQKV
jgi:hypothetical protein